MHCQTRNHFIVYACSKFQNLKLQIYMIHCHHTSNLNIMNLLLV
ncbi:hypothetical protein NC651_003624 [Populus alba x Populus x berolinensis]|nr:hypothetical protein NC651_003624 [Populus alba x Populus x berolinensis]